MFMLTWPSNCYFSITIDLLAQKKVPILERRDDAAEIKELLASKKYIQIRATIDAAAASSSSSSSSSWSSPPSIGIGSTGKLAIVIGDGKNLPPSFDYNAASLLPPSSYIALPSGPHQLNGVLEVSHAFSCLLLAIVDIYCSLNSLLLFPLTPILPMVFVIPSILK